MIVDAIENLERAVVDRLATIEAISEWARTRDSPPVFFQGPPEPPELVAYASGGTASGLSLVGERGPELVDFSQPSHVYTAGQTKAMQAAANAEMTALLRQLIEESRAANIAIAKNTGKTAKILQQFDGDGMPAERVI